MINIKEKRIGIWVKIPNWEEYEISELGEIYSLRREKLLKVWAKPNKYPRVTLSIGGNEKSFCVHRLVALAFIPNPENKITVNHIDGNKLNCNKSNLEWNTFSENQKHAIRTGLAIAPKLPLGEQHPASKLNNVDIAMIRVLLKSGLFTNKQISVRFNIHEVHVSAIKLNKTRVNEHSQELEIKELQHT